jgi:hypothetical protein
MDYKRIYKELVERARTRELIEYTERHHVIPRCIGGDDSNENIVRLTPEEHYLAHQLLTRIYPAEPKLVYAAMLMTQSSNGKRTNNKLFGWIKRRIVEARSVPHSDERKLANSLGQKGKKLSEETRQKMSLSRKGVPKTKEWAEKIAKSQQGRKKTPEQIEKNRQAQLELNARRRIEKILSIYDK